jgi:hypothetical protein
VTSPVSRRPTAGQFAGVFGAGATPVRRDDNGAPVDPGLELAAVADHDPAPLSSPPRSDPPARSSTPRTRRAGAAPARRAALDAAHRRIVEVHARRVGAALRKLEPRVRELEEVVRDAARTAPAGDVIAVIEATGWTLDDLPPAMAALLGLDGP